MDQYAYGKGAGSRCGAAPCAAYRLPVPRAAPRWARRPGQEQGPQRQNQHGRRGRGHAPTSRSRRASRSRHRLPSLTHVRPAKRRKALPAADAASTYPLHSFFPSSSSRRSPCSSAARLPTSRLVSVRARDEEAVRRGRCSASTSGALCAFCARGLAPLPPPQPLREERPPCYASVSTRQLRDTRDVWRSQLMQRSAARGTGSL